MALKFPFTNFYDSDFDSRNELSVFEDADDVLNEAFIASPGKSVSYLYNLTGMPVFNDENEDACTVPDQIVHKLPGKSDLVNLGFQEDSLKTTDEDLKKRASLESDLESDPVTAYLGLSENNWVLSGRKWRPPRVDDIASDIANIHLSDISEATESKKTEDGTECIFASTYLNEFQNSCEENDNNKIHKDSFFKMDNPSEKTEPKINISISRLEFVHHELSTIPEIDSMLIDESGELLMNSVEGDSLLKQDLKNPKVVKPNDSFEISFKAKTSRFPANVMRFIQNEHIEKLLQERGILEESVLTLISTDFDSVSRISDLSTKKRHCHSFYEIQRFDDEESPSLISFQQHELSCMRDCTDE